MGKTSLKIKHVFYLIFFSTISQVKILLPLAHQILDRVVIIDHPDYGYGIVLLSSDLAFPFMILYGNTLSVPR